MDAKESPAAGRAQEEDIDGNCAHNSADPASEQRPRLTTLSYALRLAARELRVFPCHEKKPRTPHGFKDASADCDEVRRLFRQYPGNQIGVACDDRLCVLDLDLQHIEALAWFEQHRDKLPLTRTHETPSGGRHLLFKAHSEVKNSTSKIAPHID